MCVYACQRPMLILINTEGMYKKEGREISQVSDQTKELCEPVMGTKTAWRCENTTRHGDA